MEKNNTTNTYAETVHINMQDTYICKRCIICGESIPIRSSYDFNPEVCSDCKKAMTTLKRMLNIAKYSTDEFVQ